MKPLTWRDTNCIRLRPNSKGSDNLSETQAMEAIKRSVQRWNDGVKDCSFVQIELLEAKSSVTSSFDSEGSNENALSWVESGWSHDAAAAGITIVFFIDNPESERDGQILDADIELNGENFNFAIGERGRTDVENTLVHELGHLLGLDHTCDDGARLTPACTEDSECGSGKCDSGRGRCHTVDGNGDPIPQCNQASGLPDVVLDATMFNVALPGETKKRDPTDDDIAGICSAYPKGNDPAECVSVDLSSGCAASSGRHGNPLSLIFPLLALTVLFAVQRCRLQQR